jgi:hypothetical protein
MEFNHNVWNKDRKDYFTEGEEWARIDDKGSENNEEDKTEFDLFGTALNEI